MRTALDRASTSVSIPTRINWLAEKGVSTVTLTSYPIFAIYHSALKVLAPPAARANLMTSASTNMVYQINTTYYLITIIVKIIAKIHPTVTNAAAK